MCYLEALLWKLYVFAIDRSSHLYGLWVCGHYPSLALSTQSDIYHFLVSSSDDGIAFMDCRWELYL